MGKVNLFKYTADFETSTWSDEETYVWAWSLCEIGNSYEIEIGNTIESFMERVKSLPNPLIYFHNLKFDGEFIISYLLKNGYEYISDRKYKKDMSFTTLINNMGVFYSIEVFFKVGNKSVKKVTFYDSLKVLPMKVEEIPKSFGLKINKLDLDYNKVREKGYVLTKDEEDYIKNDVKIVALALDQMFNENLTRMTIAGNSLQDYKSIVPKHQFERLFPSIPLELDKDLRFAYKGGFCYLNPQYKDETVYNVTDLDVNSLYPYTMYATNLVYGEPIEFEGKYVYDKIYPYYIQEIICQFELKENKIPTIQVKKNKHFIENEYLTSSEGKLVSLVLTNIDLELFLDHYNIIGEIIYKKGCKFKIMKGKIFKDYIDKWVTVKNEATIEGNKGKRTIAKLLLNSLYGRFATSQEVISKEPYLGDDGIVHYKYSDKELKDGLYLPVAIFITSQARFITISTSQKIVDYSLKKYGVNKYIYSDTDSIKCMLSISELKQFCKIDDVELGAWKHENVNPFNLEYSAIRAKFVRQKTYLEEIWVKNSEGEYEKSIKITCAGMPKSCYKYVEWETFKDGFTCGGKLTYKRLIGGVKLVETDFTIKSPKIKNSFKNF